MLAVNWPKFHPLAVKAITPFIPYRQDQHKTPRTKMMTFD